MTAEHTLSAIIRTRSLGEDRCSLAWKEDSTWGQALANAVMQEFTLETLQWYSEQLSGWIQSDGRAHPEKMYTQKNLWHILVIVSSCWEILQDPTVNGLTWLLTCASQSQAEVRGHGNWGLEVAEQTEERAWSCKLRDVDRWLSAGQVCGKTQHLQCSIIWGNINGKFRTTIKLRGFIRLQNRTYCSHYSEVIIKTIYYSIYDPFLWWEPGIAPLSAGRHCHLAGEFSHFWGWFGSTEQQ